MTVNNDRNIKKQEYVPMKKLPLISFKSVLIIVSGFVYNVEYLSVKVNVWIINYKFWTFHQRSLYSPSNKGSLPLMNSGKEDMWVLHLLDTHSRCFSTSWPQSFQLPCSGTFIKTAQEQYIKLIYPWY